MDDEKISKLREKLKEVVDPEIGISIMDMNLIDEVKMEENKAQITYHLTTPFCPPKFAFHIGNSIKKVAKSVEGIDEVTVILKDHEQKEDINKMLKK